MYADLKSYFEGRASLFTVGIIFLVMIMAFLVGCTDKSSSRSTSKPFVETCGDARANQAQIPNPDGDWMVLWAFETGKNYDIPLWHAERQVVIYMPVDRSTINTGKPCNNVMYRVK